MKHEFKLQTCLNLVFTREQLKIILRYVTLARSQCEINSKRLNRIVIYLIAGDPGFPRRRARTYYLAKFRRKLHENEEHLTERGGVRQKFYYVNPPVPI